MYKIDALANLRGEVSRALVKAIAHSQYGSDAQVALVGATSTSADAALIGAACETGVAALPGVAGAKESAEACK
jgi:hypothetical protein